MHGVLSYYEGDKRESGEWSVRSNCGKRESMHWEVGDQAFIHGHTLSKVFG